MSVVSRILEEEDKPETKELLSMLADDDSRLNEAGSNYVVKRRYDFVHSVAGENGDPDEIFDLIKEWEDGFLDELWEGTIPEWLIRAEAQDFLVEAIEEEKIKEQ